MISRIRALFFLFAQIPFPIPFRGQFTWIDVPGGFPNVHLHFTGDRPALLFKRDRPKRSEYRESDRGIRKYVDHHHEEARLQNDTTYDKRHKKIYERKDSMGDVGRDYRITVHSDG